MKKKRDFFTALGEMLMLLGGGPLRPSQLEEISPKYRPHRHRRRTFEDDAKALAGDREKVQGDLQRAIEQYEREKMG